MESAIARSGALSLAKRTVHVKMYPTPSSFAERREVLRVLEQFGEVTMFRSHKYKPTGSIPNAFLSMFNTESAATAAVNQSPIRYRLTSIAPEPEASTDSLGSSIAPEERPANSNPKDEKIFELHVSNTKFDHEKYIASNPLHGPFVPVSPKRSYIASSLDNVIPPSMWAPGLMDWETDGSRMIDKNRSNADISYHGEMQTGVQWRVGTRERRRNAKMADVPLVMRGLRDLKERKQAEQRELQARNGP